MRRKPDFERAQTRPFVATRRDLEAMIPVVEGREPLTIIADQAAEIREALSSRRTTASRWSLPAAPRRG